MEDGQAELAWVAGYIPRWPSGPKMVIHFSINRARRRVTSLIEINMLQLSQTATGEKVVCQKRTTEHGEGPFKLKVNVHFRQTQDSDSSETVSVECSSNSLTKYSVMCNILMAISLNCATCLNVIFLSIAPSFMCQ